MSSFPLLKVKVDADDYYDFEEKGDEKGDDFDRTLQSKVSQNWIFGLRHTFIGTGLLYCSLVV